MTEVITRIVTPIRLEYTVTAGATQERFLLALLEGRILGQRAPDGKLYVPPRGACPVSGEPMLDEYEDVPDRGTVTTYCVINIPFEGQVLEPPYIGAAILLDGADLPIFHIVGGVPPAEARMGMRVQAKWRAEPIPSLATIEYFAPLDEPDAAFESYAEHL
jgi:uncharacterized OB-fold protein